MSLALSRLAGPMRLPFLVLTPACVFLGVATAWRATGQLHWGQVMLVLLGALASHVGVNVFNEYFDFKSGLDSKTVRTPFSGGSGTLPQHPELLPATRRLALASLLIAALVGVYFVILRGWGLLPLGLLGLALVVSYTTWWAYRPLMCLIAPGLGFGLLMVLGVHFALSGSYNATALMASLVPGFLVSDLLLLNQFPDVEADRSIGRRHFPITIGRPASAKLYGVFLVLAYLSVMAGIALKLLPALAAIALCSAPLAWKAWRIAMKEADRVPGLLPAMRLNVLVNLITPVLLGLALFLG